MTSRTLASISSGLEPVREHAACQAREPERLGGVVALVGDRDHLSPSPRANSASVAEGTRLAMRMARLCHGSMGRRNLGLGSVEWPADEMDVLPDNEIESRLADLEGWARDGDAITKTFKN